MVDSPPPKKNFHWWWLKSHPFPSSHWDGLFQKAVGDDAASKHIDGHSWWDSRHPTGLSWNLTGHSGVLYWVHWILGKLFSYTTSWGYCFSSKISRPCQWIPNRKFGKWVRFWIFIFGLDMVVPHYHEPNSKIPRGQLPFSAGSLCCLHHCNVVHRHTKGGDRKRSVSARPECMLWQAHFGSLVCIPDQQAE